MGCFNQSCFISRLDIRHGDKCLIIPVVLPNREHDYESLNNGCFRKAYPFCLPIFGEYDDYGSIEKIVTDENTQAIETFFEMPIDKFIEAVTRHRDPLDDDSITWQMYSWKKDAKVNREDLEALKFKTEEDGRVTHVILTHLLEALSKNENRAKWADPEKIKLFWRGDNLVMMGRYADNKEIVFKKNSPVVGYKSFLTELSEIYALYAKESGRWIFDKEYYFGIPKVKQDKVHLLHTFKPAFARTDVWRSFAKKSAAMLAREKKQRRKWSKQYDECDAKAAAEYIKEVTAWQENKREIIAFDAMDEAGKNVLRAKWQKERDAWMALSEEDKKNTDMPKSMTRFMSSERDSLFRATHTFAFKEAGEHRAGNEFFEIYGFHLLEPEFRKRFEEFNAVEWGMITANIMLYDTHSLEQHGDVASQVQLMKNILKVGEKLRLERAKDF